MPATLKRKRRRGSLLKTGLPPFTKNEKEKLRMTVVFASRGIEKKNAMLAIGVGGLIAGTFDLICALLTFGPQVGRAIAGGLLGHSAFQGGLAINIFGFFLHFFIAMSAAAVFYFASRRLRFMTEHALISGMFFGIGLYLVMNLIVLPLCALHVTHPIAIKDLIQGLLVHMILIGLPISFSVRRFAR
jgi:hypothetical protein